jgi:putative transposase
MSDYRCWFVPGGTIFLTVVTYGRRPILTTDLGRRLLRAAIEKVRGKRPFELFATVLLPDHWHLIMRLPRGDADYSTRMKRIKEEFSVAWLDARMPEAPVTAAQSQKGERGVWQPRFWEHTIDDEADLEGCTDYIHWNPRKHELVSRVRN